MIKAWAFQWKMQFNPDPGKEAQKVYFNRKADKQNLLDLTFDKSDVATSCSQKYLGFY